MSPTHPTEEEMLNALRKINAWANEPDKRIKRYEPNKNYDQKNPYIRWGRRCHYFLRNNRLIPNDSKTPLTKKDYHICLRFAAYNFNLKNIQRMKWFYEIYMEYYLGRDPLDGLQKSEMLAEAKRFQQDRIKWRNERIANGERPRF